MVRVSSAKRYAQAVFEIAGERNELEQWQSELSQIAALTKEPQLVALLENPRLPFTRKKELLSERLEGVSPLAMNLACLLVTRGKLGLIEQIAVEYNRLLDIHHGIEHAEIITALPIDKDDRETISARLDAIVGKKVIFKTRVDPTILGGIVIRIDGRLIDGSTRGKLEALRELLKTGGSPQ